MCGTLLAGSLTWSVVSRPLSSFNGAIVLAPAADAELSSMSPILVQAASLLSCSATGNDTIPVEIILDARIPGFVHVSLVNVAVAEVKAGVFTVAPQSLTAVELPYSTKYYLRLITGFVSSTSSPLFTMGSNVTAVGDRSHQQRRPLARCSSREFHLLLYQDDADSGRFIPSVRGHARQFRNHRHRPAEQ
jgi:hypothetical protein